jgi:hypothetical protein
LRFGTAGNFNREFQIHLRILRTTAMGREKCRIGQRIRELESDAGFQRHPFRARSLKIESVFPTDPDFVEK